MQHRTRWRIALSLLPWVACGPQGDDLATIDSAAVTSQALHATDAPRAGAAAESAAIGGDKEVLVATAPHAMCTLRGEGTAGTITVWADDVGLVHLWAPRTRTGETYALDCVESDDTATHTLDLAAPSASFRTAPAAPSPKRRSRPALADPEHANQSTLIAQDYPPKPNPEKAPGAYKRWLDVVTVPMEIVETPAKNLGVTFGPATNFGSGSWGGVQLDAPGTRYVVADGRFTTPEFSPSGSSSHTSLWVGVGNKVIIQAGVQYATVGSVKVYQTWYEYFPVQLQAQDAAIPVSPGQDLYIWAWEGDAQCNPGLGHTGWGCFSIANTTTGLQTATIQVQNPANTFTGDSAEAIVERTPPTTPIASWTTPIQVSFDAWADSMQGHDHVSDPFINWTLANPSGQTMVSTDVLSSDTVSFTYVRSD